MFCRICSDIPRLYLLDVSSIHPPPSCSAHTHASTRTPKTSSNIAICSQLRTTVLKHTIVLVMQHALNLLNKYLVLISESKENLDCCSTTQKLLGDLGISELIISIVTGQISISVNYVEGYGTIFSSYPMGDD